MGKALAIALLALLCAAPRASAARAEVVTESRENAQDAYSYVSYGAALGETNRVTVVEDGGGTRLTDAGAPLDAGAGCDEISPHEVFCHAKGLSASLDDGDDSLSAPSGQVTGGDGNDTIHAGGYLRGGAGADTLVGRGGVDNLVGDGGRDVLHGAGGDDMLADGDNPETGVDSDVLDGGGGSDTVVYPHRRGPVVIDLLAGRGGQPGEEDALTNIENAYDDDNSRPTTATGNDRANDLTLFADRSVARGLGGNDYLTAASSYRDVLDAGPGDDILALTPYTGAVPDKIACGTGRDTVYFSQMPAEYVPPDCEWVRSDIDASLRYRLLGPIARLDRPFARVGYGTCDSDSPCRAVFAVRAEVGHGARSTGPLLARRVVRLAAGRVDRPSPLRLTARGRALLARRHSIRARLGFLLRGRLVEGFALRIRLAQP